MAKIKLTVPGRQIVGFTDWENPGDTPPFGNQKPSSTRERHTWQNDTSTTSIGVSPFEPDKDYVLEKRSKDPITIDVNGKPVYGISRAVVKGSDLAKPGLGDNGPGERQETVKIEEVFMLPAIYEAVVIDVEIP